MTDAPCDSVSLLRTFNTVRHLKPVQVTNRVVRRLRPHPILTAEGSATLRPRAPQLHCASPSSFQDGGFTFHHRRALFAGPDRWNPVGVPRLWSYNLHYFRYVHALDPGEAWRLIDDWMAQNPCWCGTGWEPYPLSLRIREWMEWALANPTVPPERRRRMVESLLLQVQALEAQLEFHLLGNHLLENAITLCWAGSSLDTPLAARWLEQGTRLLEDEVAVQVLADGCHDERSPMYQASIAESLLRLAGVAAQGEGGAAARVAAVAREAGSSLARSLALLTHPDGDIALLNDAALGEAPSAAELAGRFHLPAVALAPGPWHLRAAGYLGWRSDNTWLVFDAGPIGPDHQPGHGHADTLSFELSHRGQRLITDTGVTTYAPGPMRDLDRGTAAHNTIQLDGLDQCELWGAFRCGRRVRIDVATATGAEGGTTLHGRYTGPGRGARSVTHERKMRMGDRTLTVSELVLAAGTHEAMLRLHLAPSVEAVPRVGAMRLERDGRALAVLHGGGFEWRIAESPYHPEFGMEVGRRCLVAPCSFRDRLSVAWTLELL